MLNLVKLNNNQYSIQIAYIGVKQEQPIIRGIFEFIIHKINDRYFFSSTLINNTKDWKILKHGNSIFHYKNEINTTKAIESDSISTYYTNLLNKNKIINEYYSVNNSLELQKLIGINYKSEFNGTKGLALSSIDSHHKLNILGYNNSNYEKFDPHDVFHEILSNYIPRNKVYKPIDEGCAYLHGGSWGLTWKEIFKEFYSQISNYNSINWVDIKENSQYFKTKEFNNSMDYIINALIVQEIERKHGFNGVWELLLIGPAEKGHHKYYSKMQKLLDINKDEYNNYVRKLIKNEINKYK